MVKLSLWEKDNSPSAGTSFTPSFNERPKTAPCPPSFPTFRRLSTDPALTPPPASPVISLSLSSPSFLDSVVHDGISDNPLYVIETDANLTKIRRSDSKGFINVARVRWREDPAYFSKSKKELSGVQLAFGRGQWKPADEFLGYSYSSLSSYRKFYLPHHPNSLRWKRTGSSYYCTTANVKGPVAVLEPALVIAPPQIKIFDPIFHPGSTARPQRTHAGVPISLLDFLLVTSMLILTEHDEWTNVTRTGPSTANVDDAEDEDEPFRHLPPPPSVPSTPSRSTAIGSLHNPSTTSLLSGFSTGRSPSFRIDNWRSNIASERPTSSEDRWPSISRDPGSPVRASGASQSSADSDAISTPASPTAQAFSYRSGSSVSSHHRQPYHSAPSLSNPHTRDLPVPPVPTNHYTSTKMPRTTGGPDSPASSRYARSPSPISQHSNYPSQSSRDGEPWRISTEQPNSGTLSSSVSVHNLSGPASAHPSHQDSQWPSYPGSSSSSSTFSHNYPQTPTTSRSLPPIPPVPPLDRGFLHKLPLPSPNAAPPSPSLPHSPGQNSPFGRSGMMRMSTQPHRSQSHSNLRRTTIKAPPNYMASAQDNPVHPADLGLLDAMQAFGINGGEAHAPGGQALSQGVAVVMRPDSVYDAPPPAYSSLDMARSPLQ